MNKLKSIITLSLFALILTGCAKWMPSVPVIGGMDANGRLAGTLFYEKTSKHPKFGSQEKHIADGSCSLNFKVVNYAVNDRVRCGSFLIHVVGKFQSDGQIENLKLKTLGTVYNMQGNIGSSTGLEPRNGFWKATLKLKPA